MASQNSSLTLFPSCLLAILPYGLCGEKSLKMGKSHQVKLTIDKNIFECYKYINIENSDKQGDILWQTEHIGKI